MRPEDLANELILQNPELNTFGIVGDDDGEYEIRSLMVLLSNIKMAE